MDFKTKLQNLFIEYVKINTRSDYQFKDKTPTTPGQEVLAHKIVAKLQEIGLDEAYYNEKTGFVIGKLYANTPAVSGIGFIAHLDTADFNAQGVNPQVHPNYDGEKLVLNQAKKIVLDPNEFPDLKKLKGQTLITTDGTSLLGTDDKAGIVAAIGALAHLKQHPEIKHGEIDIGFGPDEEIGLGGKRFDPKDFNVEFAYTLDNGQPGELQYETFNASSAHVEIEGTSVHPGNAYGLLVNAGLIANQFISALPKDQVPEKTQAKEGFILVNNASFSVGHAEIDLIIRDFDWEKFLQKEAFVKELAAKLNREQDHPRILVTLRRQYENIANSVIDHPYVVNLALDAYRNLGLTPKVTPFRGGTDGNFITAKGIPTPNLFNGGGNYHGQYEYITSEQMVLTAQTIVEITKEHVRQTLTTRDERPLA